MKTALLNGLAALSLACAGQTRLTERSLSDIARVGIPSDLTNEDKTTYGDDKLDRLTFGFASTFFWASFGSITAYRQQLIVSVMAPDASDAEYAALPGRMGIFYEQAQGLPPRALGIGTLVPGQPVLRHGVYTEWMADPEPRYQLLLPLGRVRAAATVRVAEETDPVRLNGLRWFLDDLPELQRQWRQGALVAPGQPE